MSELARQEGPHIRFHIKSCKAQPALLGPLVIQGESGHRLYVFHQKWHTHLFQLFSKLSVFIPFPFLRLQISLNITGNTGILQWTEMECHLGRLTGPSHSNAIVAADWECSANIIYSSGGVHCGVGPTHCLYIFLASSSYFSCGVLDGPSPVKP